MTRRIGIDARALTRGPAGIATYVRNLLSRIELLDPLATGFPANNFLWNQLTVPMAQLRRRWILYHASSYTAPLVNRCPLVVTAPDVSYLVNPEWYPYQLNRLRTAYYRTSLLKADRVIVTSEFSRSELERCLPEMASRVRVTYLGVDDEFRHSPERAAVVRERFELPEQFVLHVGDIHRRRNLHVLAAACRRVSAPLVLVGKVLDTAGFPAGPGVTRLQGLSLADLIGVYSAATLLGYPSLYEGFGLPVLEAMACRLPVVAARRASIPEVAGQAAVLVEPGEEELERGLREAMEAADDLAEAGWRRSRQFRWEDTAGATLEIYRELL